MTKQQQITQAKRELRKLDSAPEPTDKPYALAEGQREQIAALRSSLMTRLRRLGVCDYYA